MNENNNNNNFNDSADFWKNEIGANPLPANTKNKVIKVKWKEDQDKSISNDLHESRKQNGEYNDGIAVMTGKIHQGKYKNQYLIGIDCDNKNALDEILTRDRKTITLQELANWTRVEQHKDNLDKAHIYIRSTKPFKNKGRDARFAELEAENEVPAIEIKCEHFTMFTAPSIHANGYPYEVLGVKELVLYDKFEIDLDNIFRKYGIEYLVEQNNNNNNYTSKLPEELRQLIKSQVLEIPENFTFRIHKGSRHPTLVSFASSLLIRYKIDTNTTNDQLKDFFYQVNEKLCYPEPLPSDEIQQIWKDCLKWSNEKAVRLKLEGDDINDTSTYKSQLTIPLEYEHDDRLLEVVQSFVYDIQKNSADIQLNSVYKPGTRLIVPINIKQWPDVKKSLKNQCIEKEIDEPHILALLEAFDKNLDRITKHYLKYYRKSNATLAAIQKNRQQRKQLVRDGTEFLLSMHRWATIKKVNDILSYNPEKGKFEYGGEEIIGEELEKKYGYQIDTGIVNEIRDHIIRKTGVTKNKFDFDPDIINVKNGLLNIRTRELLPHTPDYLSLNQLPINYKPEAKAPKYEKFQKDVFYPDQIRTANEIVAYTFIRKNLFQYWVVLIGNGGNGKNVFISIITALHGDENVSNVSLAHLGNLNLRFTLSQLENKNVNFDTELSPKSYNDLSTLKKLTDTQQIPIERKGKDPYDAELWAKQILSCNKLPASSDDTDARYRREIVLPFPHQFVEEMDEEQQNDPNIKIADPFLLEKIINDEDEMSGILNIVLDSLQSIYENKKIYSNSTISQRRLRAELIVDPVKAFYNENCKVPDGSEEFETKDNLYNKFVEFCTCKKIPPKSRTKFFKQLREEYGTGNEGREISTDENGNKHSIRTLSNIHLLTNEEKKKRDEQNAD